MSNVFDKFNDHMTPKSSITTIYRLVCVVNSLLPFAVQDALGTLNESKEKSEQYAADQTSSDLLNSTSEIKAAFSEASHSLNLFESFLEEPSQETAKQLKLLSDRGKNAYNDFFSAAADNTDLHFLFKVFLPSRTVKKCVLDDYKEHNISSEFDHGSFNSDIIQDHEHGKIPTTCRGDSQYRKKEAFGFMPQPNGERTKELEKELVSLKEQLERYEETLFELGKFTVEETAKRNEERKSKIFHQIYHSSLSGAKLSLPSTSPGTPINDTLVCPMDHYDGDPQKSVLVSHSSTFKLTTANGNPSILNASPSASFSKQSASRAETLLQGSVSSTFSGNSENTTPENQNSPTIKSTQKANGGNGSTQSGDVGTNSTMGMTSRQNSDDLSFSVQQHDSGMESITLAMANKPATSVATTLYNNYKLLLLTLAQRLLSSELVVLKDWAAQNFSIVNPQNATDVFFQLDEKRVINASDLSRLCNFLESIIRFDLVYIVDAFLLGDYSLLRQNTASKIRSTNGAQNSRHRSTSRSMNPGQYSIHQAAPGNISQARKPENSGGAQNSVLRQTQQGASLRLSLFNTGNLNPFSRSANENRFKIAEQPNPVPLATEFTSQRKIDVGVTEDPIIRETMAANSSPKPNPSTKNSLPVISNGSKLSKFQRSDAEGTNVFNFQSCGGPRHQNLDQDDNWLCSHYKRHCYVKFECCDKFWPCHRCHNNQSTCGQKKLKSRDTRMLKCVYCHKVQEFGEHCCNCGAKFASYYCGLCKHLTGKDDHPYHCEKCGICRIHGDRSFHCDVCGVCLDVQLRGNHKCREGSAHDECCICLEVLYKRRTCLRCGQISMSSEPSYLFHVTSKQIS